jgi:hypothetical protein
MQSEAAVLNPAGHSALRNPEGEPDRRLRIVVFIDHDIVYRHFVHSRVFSDLISAHDVTFVFPKQGPDNKRLTTSVSAAEVGATIEWVPIESERIEIWRRLFQVSQLRWRPGAEWRHLRAITRHLIGARASRVYAILGLPGIYQLFRAYSLRRLASMPTTINGVLDRLKPDVIIHPSVLEGTVINDVVEQAERRGVPSILIMNSWDNPATKRAVVGNPSHLLVWGPQTRDLAVKFMNIPPARVTTFGAAQFDIFRKAPRITREAFCAAHDVDPSKRVLLYAGSSKGSDEFAHLQSLEAAIDDGTLANVAVIYRPHPWGKGGYKGERLLDHPWRHVRIERSMRSYLEEIRAGKKRIYLADYADTHDVLSSIDALVSPLSTILLEGGLHGKPVLCFVPDEKEGSSLKLQARLVHFDAMYENPLFLKAHGDAALVGKIAELMALVSDADFSAQLQRACEFFVQPETSSYSERLRTFVENVAAERATKLSPTSLHLQ